MILIESLWLAILGLVIGSFTGAASWRMVRDISIADGRSFCDSCKKKLTWYDNIPLFSYLFLRGKCRNCQKKISPRYPLIEGSFAIGFLLIGIFIDPIRQNITFVPNGILGLVYILTTFSLLGAILITDLENQIIPDNLSFILLTLTFFVLLLFGGEAIFEHLFSGLLAGTFLLMLHLITRGRGMGLGDVKFALSVGIILGFQLTLVWLLGSFIIGSVAGLVLLVFGKTQLGKRIAFGPFMVISLAVVSILGSIIVRHLFN